MREHFLVWHNAVDYPCINKQNPLILASGSPRRKGLLTQVGLPFRSEESHVTEVGYFEDPQKTVCLLAEKKARDVYSGTRNAWILGADTIVVVESPASEAPEAQKGGPDIILGKPKEEKEATHMLRLLSGREHRVITGFCILNPAGREAHSEAVVTRVYVKELNDQEIAAYVRTNEPFGKAGGYAIQGIGAFMVKGISGSYTNVVGLPLFSLIKALIAVGGLKSFPLPDDL